MSPARRAAALALAACCLPLAARADRTVGWRNAARCANAVCSVRGTVAVVEDDGPTYRLYFDDSDRSVRVILMRGWLVNWPNYLGQEIVATGKVGRFRDHLEMILLDPRSIELVGGTPTTTPEPSPTASVAPASPTASVAAPTSGPTAEPTIEPTSEPTSEPTAAPTAPPSPVPTAIPTSVATSLSTSVPSPAPATPADEVERLRERVRELEERLRRFEPQP